MTAIVDYRAGNLTSVRLAFESIGAPAVVTADPAAIRSARRILFPGVGAAGAAMANLAASGLEPVLRERVAAGVPFLGICLGTQILFERSEEDGGTPCLGLLRGEAKRFAARSHAEKIPQMGWNQARIVRAHPLLDGIPDGSDFYFVHSYYPAPADAADVVCTTDYCGVSFASMVGRGNVAATQFHPEKSGPVGLRLLENFVRWTP
ncbi:MAG: imidazole glycerol phosphate synthase subunit HisH [Kiritimatiellae bacterium]|nr:imidazole glycerol phosphate synthase subunit HisH [Kiritimatiellia bacterium]